MMFGYSMAGGFGWVFMVLWWALLFAGAVVLIRWLMSCERQGKDGISAERSALEILAQRYARGEIDSATFQRMKSDLLSTTDDQTSQ